MDAGRESTGGFTLIEALVALTLSLVLVGLVSSVFLAQSGVYENVVHRSEVHDVVRSVGEILANDVRSAPPHGILVADSLDLVVHVPLTRGIVCSVSSDRSWGYYPRPSSGLDTANVTGFGIRQTDGTWFFYEAGWSTMLSQAGGTGPSECAAIGMDVSGVDDSEFLELIGPGSSLANPPDIGRPIMLQRKMRLSIQPSTLDPGTLGLHRGTEGGDMVEFAAGLGPDSGFSYRLNGENDFQSSVSGSDLLAINAVRITVQAVGDVDGSGGDGYATTLKRDIPLRNPN